MRAVNHLLYWLVDQSIRTRKIIIDWGKFIGAKYISDKSMESCTDCLLAQYQITPLPQKIFNWREGAGSNIHRHH